MYIRAKAYNKTYKIFVQPCPFAVLYADIVFIIV